MRHRPPRPKSFPALRHGFIAAALLAYFVAAVGVPLPVVTQKDRSVPFPCMDRACGCHDASGCKQHCCCFTSEQKLAWAAECNVDPTPFVNDLDLIAALPAEHEKTPERAAACCARAPHQPDAPARHHDDGAISISAYRLCHGLAPLWSTLGAALPPPRPAEYEFLWSSSNSLAIRAPVATILNLSPPTPPPRG